MLVSCPAFCGEIFMNLLTDKVKKIYSRYLLASFGSALISSIYSLVDTAVVGQYHGPEGAAAMAVVAPIWNIVYSLGLLFGIGGSVLFATMKGQGKSQKEQNQYFTAAFLGTSIIAVIVWIAIFFFDEQMLTLFGGNEELLPLALRYLFPIKCGIPLFMLNQLLAAFLRNDGAPGLATRAVLAGGLFNIAGDIIFVFVFDMGAFGAGLATILGALLTSIVMGSHFLPKKNTLKLVKPVRFGAKIQKIFVTGFSTFVNDIAMGVLTILFNRQIMQYLGTDALAVYGVIVNLSTVVQSCAYGVGNAAQPIMSINFGARQPTRIKQTLRYGIFTAAALGLIWMAAAVFIPNTFTHIFMTPTDSVLSIAPTIFRIYGLSFLILPLNIFSTYYFQSLLKPAASFCLSLARGIVLSGILIMVLPLIFGATSLWAAMPVTEVVVAIVVVILMVKFTKNLDEGADINSLETADQ